jgi:hypothetical protein
MPVDGIVNPLVFDGRVERIGWGAYSPQTPCSSGLAHARGPRGPFRSVQFKKNPPDQATEVSLSGS